MGKWLILALLASAVTAAGLCFLHPAQKPAEAADGPALIVYWDTDFGGRSLVVTDTLLDLPTGIDEQGEEFDWNDQISSIEVLSGSWRLYEHGRCNTELDDTPLQDVDLSTQPPVSGWVALFSGASTGSVRYSSAASGAWENDSISSIELVSKENLPDWAIMEPR